jgi:hypothetical protein
VKLSILGTIGRMRQTVVVNPMIMPAELSLAIATYPEDPSVYHQFGFAHFIPQKVQPFQIATANCPNSSLGGQYGV